MSRAIRNNRMSGNCGAKAKQVMRRKKRRAAETVLAKEMEERGLRFAMYRKGELPLCGGHERKAAV